MPPPPPALATTPSNPFPNEIADAMSRMTSSSTVTSATTVETFPPAARIPSAVASNLLCVRPQIVTLAPSSAAFRAHAAPMPVPPPVTTTEAPAKDRLVIAAPLCREWWKRSYADRARSIDEPIACVPIAGTQGLLVGLAQWAHGNRRNDFDALRRVVRTFLILHEGDQFGNVEDNIFSWD